MSRLPPEISDHVVDLLHDEPDALRMCCLVSKSWVPCAQKHLFHEVVFDYRRWLAWRDTFPDPFNSPTNHTRYLLMTCDGFTPGAPFEKGAWSQSFFNVVCLRVSVYEILDSALFELVYSLPHLEDLAIISSQGVDDDFDEDTIFSLPSPPLTGSLVISVPQGMGFVVRRLLELPNGIRFRKLEATVFSEEDLRHAIAVVEECSETLECIEILCGSPVSPWAGSIDFSEVINLKDVAFGLAGPEDVSFTFQIDPPDVDDPDVDDIRNAVGERVYRQWMDLDRVLFQLWESKKIHTKVIYATMGEAGDALEYVVALLPEMTKRGLVDLVDDGYV